ncbi:MAG: glycine cleavage system aminomethyltransferase GcvT [Clostridiales Family XIII bacterium]|jgi:aminomethyltransferase|nr:glycine cleavage system aminomethyltransferase GcvT [Clostridiales Family XIII bacterium]
MKQTILHAQHEALGAKLVDFAGYDMPLNYPTGVLAEHLHTRKHAGIFDISHMGRFLVSGPDALPFLQHVLTNNVASLDLLQAQYTFIPNAAGGAMDDAYLYRFWEKEYLLVVNASNAEKDLAHLTAHLGGFDATITDRTEEIGMVSVQGPASREILMELFKGQMLTEPLKNELNILDLDGTEIWVAKTGYTGDALGFELFSPAAVTPALWEKLIDLGAAPTGLGARDTLRLEAALPLYGHELGEDADGREIPIFAVPLAKFAVSFAENKGDFIGRAPLEKQHAAFLKIFTRHFDALTDEDVAVLPRVVKPFALLGKGVPRAGCKVYKGDKEIGVVTSGNVIPYYETEGAGLETAYTDDTARRFIGLALVDADMVPEDRVGIEIRGGKEEAVIVKYHLRGDAPPYAQSIVYGVEKKETLEDTEKDYSEKALELIRKAERNHVWRQSECLNLIPSEMTHSRAARILSVLDPSFRYGEHKKMKAFYDYDVFYYQGTKFIHEVEQRLAAEFQKYFGCKNAEVRTTSGQMANTAVFSALMDFKNRADRKRDPRRLGYVMNNHIIKGGHLSAQPMGALKDYIAVDPVTDRPALVNFPVLAENPYKIDVAETRKLVEEYRPELIIFGKSMVLHREPVAEIRAFVDGLGLETIIMYDMAHVLGLVGPYFQDPFADGAEIVTGSTHKTFFGTQRGVIVSNYEEPDVKYDLWETIETRVFPGSVSNHHLGSLLGLLVAAYEMNAFKDVYQKAVIENAKSFAKALADEGLSVAGDPAVSYTETHQVIVDVGYADGPDIAERLEENGVIVNYQATPDEEGFTASGALRLGVSEMTRFGFGEAEFRRAAALMADVILRGKNVREDVKKLRANFTEMEYCFKDKAVEDALDGIAGALL